MFWKDTEVQVLTALLDELWKLREDAAAQTRVLRYVVARLGLPLLVVKARPLVPDIDRVEEIEPFDWTD